MYGYESHLDITRENYEGRDEDGNALDTELLVALAEEAAEIYFDQLRDDQVGDAR